MKKAHVYLFGIVTSKATGDVGEDNYNDIVGIKTIRAQIASAGKGFEEIVIHVNSPGGEMEEGFRIHDYLRSFGVKITSVIEGRCASIATVVHLAAEPENRFQFENVKGGMIHNPWGGVEGEAWEIEEYAAELRKAEDKLAKFYEQKTNLTYDEAVELMKVTTEMDTDDAIEYGFINDTIVEFKACAMLRKFSNNSQINNKSKMAQPTPKKPAAKVTKTTTAAKEKKPNSMLAEANKLMDGLRALIKTNSQAAKAKAKAEEIECAQVELADGGGTLYYNDGEEIAVGTVMFVDEAMEETLDADTYTLDSGTILTVGEDGAIEEVEEAQVDEDEEEETQNEEVEELKEEVKSLKAQAKKDAKALSEATAAINEANKLMKQFQSSYKPDGRQPVSSKSTVSTSKKKSGDRDLRAEQQERKASYKSNQKDAKK